MIEYFHLQLLPNINDSPPHSMASTLKENILNNLKIRDDDMDDDSRSDCPANLSKKSLEKNYKL